MELLSKWRVKPYIDLYLWEIHYKAEFPLYPKDTYIVIEHNRHSVHLKLDGNELEYTVSLADFNEIMYQIEDAPPLVDEPKPCYHGKRIRVRDSVTNLDIRYYAGDIWNATWVEGMEGRGSKTISGYSLMTDGNTGVCLSKTFVEKWFEEVE